MCGRFGNGLGFLLGRCCGFMWWVWLGWCGRFWC